MNRCQPKIPEIISRVPAGKSADSREQHFVARFRLHERNAVFSVCAIYALPGRPFLTRVSSGVKVRGGGKGLKTAGKTSLNSTSLQLVFLPQPWSRCVPLGRASCDPSLRLSAPPSARGWSTRLGGLEARLGERVNDTPCNFYRDSRNCWTFLVEFLNNDCD